jgi:hypothetical protein
MRPAIDLDDQQRFTTKEIDKVRSDGRLADELEATEPPAAEVPPQLRFGHDVMGPEDTGAVRFPGLRATHCEFHSNDCTPT